LPHVLRVTHSSLNFVVVAVQLIFNQVVLGLESASEILAGAKKALFALLALLTTGVGAFSEKGLALSSPGSLVHAV